MPPLRLPRPTFPVLLRLAGLLVLLSLPAGCTSLGSSPTTKDGLLRLPMSQNAAFEKRVQSDPFPSANQALGNSLQSRTF